MAAKRSWLAGKCPLCSGQLGLLNVKVTLRNGFACPYWRNGLRLRLIPLILVSALPWALFDVSFILLASRDGGESIWVIGVAVLDIFVFFALLAPFFARARQSARNAA